MRVVQLIDSLRPGGAERMAVNIANALVRRGQKAFICCSRKEGLLKESIEPQVVYLFLNKKNTLDFEAIKRFRHFIRIHNITVIHAHGTSFFFATLQRLFHLDLKVVWHDHYGNRVNKRVYSFPILYICSYFFNGIIAVNRDLLNWSQQNLKASKVVFINNFIDTIEISPAEHVVNDSQKGISIICLANLRTPKNHINLLVSFLSVFKEFPNCRLYLVGKTYHDEYFRDCMNFIQDNNLEENVIIIKETLDIYQWLQKADIGVLSSDTEGLPMALLEYGVAKLAVVCTRVGQCPEILGENGKIVEPNNSGALAKALLFYIQNEEQRIVDAQNYHLKVLQEYSSECVIMKFSSFYSSLFQS